MVDFAKIIGFNWDDGNARKNEKHGVTMAEAEQVFFDLPLLVLDDTNHSQKEVRMRKKRSAPFMTKQTKAIPTFANEAEERAYWKGHDSTLHLDWSKAKQVSLPHLKPTTKTISLRLPQHLLDSIKIAANARDVPYQSLIKVWLQEKLNGY